ncbi:WD40-repeat-containing domain protein [Jimgerdemannia flammicorona]|uniref:WD40-repeat-containing domain protein n=1 Tax=Jimgerdemannia flammicorona TaxID=994334 RepID=A0A433DIF2_9FUNG|nr:WD40-repeat-containing domain protein [Jimgerdemannia flammicorona]
MLLQLPYISVQHDWHEAIADVACAHDKPTNSADTFWISAYGHGKGASIHTSVTVRKADSGHAGVELTGEGGMEVTLVNHKTIKISYPAQDISNVTVHAPRAAYKVTDSPTRIPKPINSIDVSPGGELFVVGGDAGDLKIGELDGGAIRRDLKGHFGDITTCRFFPSGQVILSGASDFQLRIWSALDGLNPVTLKGHRAASSRDGTIKLWECGKHGLHHCFVAPVACGGCSTFCTPGTFSPSFTVSLLLIHKGSAATISTLGNYATPVNKIAIGTVPSTLRGGGDVEVEVDSREVETEDKLLLAAVSDGSLRGIDLRSKAEVFATSAKSAASIACAYAPQWNLVVSGDAQGVINAWDLRDIRQYSTPGTIFELKPLVTFYRNEYPIQDVVISKDDKGAPVLFIATVDGAACQTSPLLSADPSSLRVTHEYSGFDMDPIANLRLLGKQGVVCAGRDGVMS